MASTKIVQALNKALREEMDRDENVILMGEDIGVFNGPFRVTEGLYEKYGEERVRDTPISESTMVGMCVGAAMTGLRPVVEIQFEDFITTCFDPIVNHAAKIHLMLGGQYSVPIVIRAPYGSTTRGAHHCQSVEAWFAHVPGLKVIMPSTPYDAKGLLKSAIRDNNPVLFFEHKMLYGAASPGGASPTAVDQLDELFKPAPDEEYLIEIGKADIKRTGKDVTVVALGYMVHKCAEAAKQLSKEGIEVELIDPRTVAPLDMDTIIESVKKTGRLVVVHEATSVCSISSEIAAQIAEKALFELDAPIRRVCAKEAPMPFSPVCEKHALPSDEEILSAIRDVCRC